MRCGHLAVSKLSLKLMKTALMFAEDSKCAAKGVACVLSKGGAIISTGVNGTAPGAVNCNDIFHKFDGTWYKSTGSGMLPAFPNGDFIKLNEVYFLKCGDQREHYRWSMLHEVHAETNALGRAAKLGTSTEGADAYITYSPCPDCAKALAVAGIANIYYLYQFDWLETITEFLEGYGVNLLPMNKEWLS